MMSKYMMSKYMMSKYMMSKYMMMTKYRSLFSLLRFEWQEDYQLLRHTGNVTVPRRTRAD